MTGRGDMLAGRYRLVEEIGRGAMGTVWRARDEALRRDVAVKELVLRDKGDPARREKAVRRALREARATAVLRHPGIVTVHDVVHAEERPWIVMELLSGRSLDKIVEEEGPLAPERAAAIGGQVLDALELAHERGVVHRDVKPANIFLREDGRAVLTDFGIAWLAGDPALTRPGALVGSPAYMAPERVRGESGGSASDLWSLGATLYALVEGQPPFGRRSSMGVLGSILTEEPQPPQRAGPLAPVLLRLLTKDPEGRPTVEEVRRELAAVTAGDALPRPEEAEGRSGESRPRRGRRRTIALAVALGVCALAAPVVVPVLTDDRRSPVAASPQTRPTPVTAIPSMCGLFSVEQMSRFVPTPRASSFETNFMSDYFARHPTGSNACRWYEKDDMDTGFSAMIRAIAVKARPSEDAFGAARGDFAMLRREAEESTRSVHGVGEEAFGYDTRGDDSLRAVIVARSANLLVEVRYGKSGETPPLQRLRDDAAELARWTIAALHNGGPIENP
ncbi:serine/threonine-protein kinase [Actinomadura rubrobrunea]|nr:serine/threonine-protein kinase [Actinomadura rubrobrunea]